jgi:hypothetical protein
VAILSAWAGYILLGGQHETDIPDGQARLRPGDKPDTGSAHTRAGTLHPGQQRRTQASSAGRWVLYRMSESETLE